MAKQEEVEEAFKVTDGVSEALTDLKADSVEHFWIVRISSCRCRISQRVQDASDDITALYQHPEH